MCVTYDEITKRAARGLIVKNPARLRVSAQNNEWRDLLDGASLRRVSYSDSRTGLPGPGCSVDRRTTIQPSAAVDEKVLSSSSSTVC